MIRILFFLNTVLVIFSCSENSKGKMGRTNIELPPDSIPWTFSLIRETYDKILIPALKDSIINHTEGGIIDRQFGHLCAQDTVAAKEYVLLFAKMYTKGIKPKTPKEFYPKLKYANDSIYHSDENFYHH